MKIKTFVSLLILMVLFCALSVYLQYQYEFTISEFSNAGGGFLLAVIFLFDYRNASKPMEDWGAWNSVKHILQRKGKLHLYKRWSLFTLVLSLLWGIIFFLIGIIKVLF
jgi:hypothetical protein